MSEAVESMQDEARSSLPANWARVRLPEISTINPTLDKSEIDDDLSVSFVPMPAVEAETGKIDVSTPRPFAEVRKGYTGFLEGDVLFAKITPCMENGKMAVVPALKNDLGFGSTEFHVLRPAGGTSPDYLYYFVSSKAFRIGAEHNMTGAVGQRRVPAAFLDSSEIPLPPAAEQQRIVAKLEELFSELDKGVENLRTAQQQLKVYRQALLKHAFEGKLTAGWRTQNPDKLESAEALLARIQQEREARYQQQLQEWQDAQKAWEAAGKPAKPKAPKALPPLTAEEQAGLPELPEGWAWFRVSHLLAEELCNGKSVKDRSGGFPVLRLNALANGKIDLSITKPGDWDEDEARQYFVQEGDFLVSRGNGSKHLVGRGGFASYKSAKCEHVAFPDTMIRIRLLPENICQLYFGFCWDSLLLRHQIEKDARTTAGIYKINQELIAGFILPLPCREEQELIERILSEKLSNLDQLENTITNSLQQAEALRQSILKKAFSGQLVAQHRDDEPASALLERIRAERAAQQPTTRRGRQRRTEA